MNSTLRPKTDFSIQKEPQKLAWFKLPIKFRNLVTDKLDDVSRLKFYFSSYQTLLTMPNNCIKGITVSNKHGMRITMVDRKQPVLTWYKNYAESCLAVFQLLIQKNPDSLRAVNYIEGDFDIEHASIKSLKNLSMAIVTFKKHGMLDCGYTDLEQLYQLTDFVTVKHITLNLEQVLKFKAAYMTFEHVIISASDIKKYLKLFMKGQINRKSRELTLHLDQSSHFSPLKVILGFDCLGMIYEREAVSFALVSSTDPCQIGIVRIRENLFSMEILSKKEFFEDENLSRRFGEHVKENLRDSFVFLNFEDLSV